MTYAFSIENGTQTRPQLDHLYRQHYAEMAARLGEQGVEISGYDPRVDEYEKAWDAGYLLNFIVRFNGEPVGYSNIYVTNDMHNGEKIAQEDTLFVCKEHRNGIGRKFVEFGLSELRKRGVRRLVVSAVTDLRVAKLWKRMGFKEVAIQMAYTF